MTSCEDFLQPTSEGAYSTDTYFQTDQQAIDAIDALYDGFQDEGCFGREIMWEQGAANDFVWGRTRGYPALATLSLTGSVGPLNDAWGKQTGLSTNFSRNKVKVILQLLKHAALVKLTSSAHSLISTLLIAMEQKIRVCLSYAMKTLPTVTNTLFRHSVQQ